MERVDPAEEWRNLKENYTHMTDEQLQVVADDGYDLTDIARKVLESEIAGRGLNIRLREAPVQKRRVMPGAGLDSINSDDFPVEEVHLASGLDEAGRIQCALNEANIPSCLGPDNLENIDRFPPGFTGEIMVKVCGCDYSRAAYILDELLPQRRLTDDDLNPEVLPDSQCPNCQSTDIIFRSSDPDRDPGLPVDSTYFWYCEDCLHQWKDDGEDDAEI